MEIPKDASGVYEAIVVPLYNLQVPDEPYFDLTNATSATLHVRRLNGTNSTFTAEIVSSQEIDGGSEAMVRYVPSANDFPDLGSLRAYFEIVDDSDDRCRSNPFVLNVVPRF